MNKLICFCAAGCLALAEPRAKNVILLLADAGGTSTLHAASIHGHGDTRKLYVQSMPHIGLSDTSTASNWVSDSAAGMTAIVTGVKTHNGVLSQSAKAVRGKSDGEPLETILEHAEKRGLSTGIITNRPVHDATPAACYAQVNDRRKTAEIWSAFLKPRFGDGVDLMIGPGRKSSLEAAKAAGRDLLAEIRSKGYALYDSPESLLSVRQQQRAVALFDANDYDLAKAFDHAVAFLSRNKKGYFLMVEWDAHTDNPKSGLDNVVAFDRAIAGMATRPAMKDTLFLFTADHSFDLRVIGGKRGEPLVTKDTKKGAMKGTVQVFGSHAGDEVLVAAQGPGASRVRGYMDNTRLFHVMMAAYGWAKSTSKPGK